jgi:hypothetical protein
MSDKEACHFCGGEPKWAVLYNTGDRINDAGWSEAGAQYFPVCGECRAERGGGYEEMGWDDRWEYYFRAPWNDSPDDRRKRSTWRPNIQGCAPSPDRRVLVAPE